MSILPKFFKRRAPEKVAPVIPDYMGICESCGKLDFDGTRCASCDYCPVPPKPVDPESFNADMRRAEERFWANLHKCNGCTSRFAIVTVTYPLYVQHTGELIGETSDDLCLPCYQGRHGSGEEPMPDPIMGEVPTAVEVYDVAARNARAEILRKQGFPRM